jgi:hypothetical protein
MKMEYADLAAFQPHCPRNLGQSSQTCWIERGRSRAGK